MVAYTYMARMSFGMFSGTAKIELNCFALAFTSYVVKFKSFSPDKR